MLYFYLLSRFKSNNSVKVYNQYVFKKRYLYKKSSKTKTCISLLKTVTPFIQSHLEQHKQTSWTDKATFLIQYVTGSLFTLDYNLNSFASITCSV